MSHMNSWGRTNSKARQKSALYTWRTTKRGTEHGEETQETRSGGCQGSVHTQPCRPQYRLGIFLSVIRITGDF